MPTSEQILASIDERLGELMPVVAGKQQDYLAAHGRYFQGLVTHSAPPADGEGTTANRLSDHPTDQQHTWFDVGFPLDSPRVAVQIDSYGGPLGQGYILRLTLAIEGTLWQRAIGFGPEPCDEPWHELETA